MRKDCDYILEYAIRQMLPDEAVRRALSGYDFSSGRLILVAVGKAAWSMALSAYETLGSRISDGIVITKHGYSQGPIGDLKIREAGHPMPDDSSFSSTGEALEMTEGLSAEDTVLFLLSGGGSTLFENPKCSVEDLQDVTRQLLAKGADIVSMNKIRKRLSNVKTGATGTNVNDVSVVLIRR